MKYYRYFELFLNIEDQLCNYIRQLEYSEKSKHIFAPKISLLLLQACPIIESYMVHLCTTSNEVIGHQLYNWKYNWKLWDSKDRQIKENDGKRSISKFPKFAYIIEKVFSLSKKECTFYFSNKFHYLKGNEHFNQFSPYQSLSSFVDYNKYNPKEINQFPTGLETPKWWTAYNKIKHDLDEAEKRVTYAISIEAISALFILLSSADTEFETLEDNGFIKGGEIRSKLFACKIS